MTQFIPPGPVIPGTPSATGPTTPLPGPGAPVLGAAPPLSAPSRPATAPPAAPVRAVGSGPRLVPPVAAGAPAGVQAPATKGARAGAGGLAARPPVHLALLKRRHKLVFVSFLFCVLLPGLVSGIYLWARAADQYASTVAFSVRKEEVSSAIELLGGITALSGSSSSDTDILYEFIQSQKLVAEIDADIDLRTIWSKPKGDPIFAYDAPGTIEDLTQQWDRMVRIYYDSSTSLIEIRALAFTPEDATAIANAVYKRSSEMINSLSDIAREDSLRYSREELDRAVELLKVARAALTAFRNRTQMVDPAADLQAQTGLLGNLQAQLAEALIEVDLLDDTTRAGDPRMDQAQRRVRVIEDRIASERRKLGIGDQAQQGQVYADLVGEYERLVVDREFAERSYTAALVAYDASLAEAQRQSRYLAAHVLPTQAEKSQYPQRGMLLGLIMLFAFLIWGIVVLLVYSLKDRR